uniref:Uncharacterized protein n=1 Tax=Arundo donax TaxID=35708 RepID=A0A0A8YS18_ARUDO
MLYNCPEQIEPAQSSLNGSMLILFSSTAIFTLPYRKPHKLGCHCLNSDVHLLALAALLFTI